MNGKHRVLGGSLLAICLTIAGCSESSAAPIQVGKPAEAPRTAQLPTTPGFLGIVTASRSVDIVAKEEGILAKFRADLGDTVQAHEVVAELDTPGLEADLAMARAALRAQRGAIARSSAAAREAARLAHADRELAAAGYISADSAQSTLATRQQASAAVAEAAGQRDYEAARVTQLEARLADTAVRAPFSARVAARFVDPGAAVTPGTKILRLVAEGDLTVRFAVPAAEAVDLQPGSEIVLCREGSGPSGIGLVKHAAPEIDAASGMVFFEGDVAALDSPLPGERVRVRRSGPC